MIHDYDLGANPMPSWNTPSGQKRVVCGYNTHDATTDIITVTSYQSEHVALSVDPGTCPATANLAATTSGWWTSTAATYTYECVANCADWACDSTLAVEDAESAGVGKTGVGAFRSLVATLIITLALWYRP